MYANKTRIINTSAMSRISLKKQCFFYPGFNHVKTFFKITWINFSITLLHRMWSDRASLFMSKSEHLEWLQPASDTEGAQELMQDDTILPLLNLLRRRVKGNCHPHQYSCLENTTDRGAWWATFHGVTKSQMRLSSWEHGKKKTRRY